MANHSNIVLFFENNSFFSIHTHWHGNDFVGIVRDSLRKYIYTDDVKYIAMRLLGDISNIIFDSTIWFKAFETDYKTTIIIDFANKQVGSFLSNPDDEDFSLAYFDKYVKDWISFLDFCMLSNEALHGVVRGHFTLKDIVRKEKKEIN